jgi:Ca2+-binding RTX toxin-like protein
MAITASFDPVSGVLTVIGDVLDNAITVGRNAAGDILINGGAVPIQGGTATIVNTTLIQGFGLGGNDTITLDESNGALPAANFFGGEGNDTLIGGAGTNKLFGQGGNDTLLGKGGIDFLFGGDDNDTLTGGDADDQVFGESGDDRMIWDPGDDTDLNEGGDGTDTVEVNGGSGAEVFTTTANGLRVRFDRLDPAPFSIDIGTSENLVLNANGGNDSFSATGNLAALIKVTVDGSAGNDILLGTNGIDLFLGGDGDDFVDGQQGNDVALLGAGDDVFQWDPGDGSDIVEGQDGTDTLLFNGSTGDEIFAASANGGRVLFTRNFGNIVMDLNDVETIDLNALGGTDTTTVNDLSGTDVTEVNVDLAGTLGGTAGDGAADVVIVNATNGADIIDVVGAGSSVSVLGLAARTNVTNSEGANDSLVINGLGGDDSITATTLPAGVTKLTIDGGAGDDTILGSQGADVILGGDGNDFVFGDNGNDLALMGAGDDVFQWNPGDGNDTIEGQDGTDTMLFLGANIAENIDISANGGRVLFFRNIASVTMDLNDVERIDFRALGGADNITVGDLSGTDVTAIDLDLRGPNGGGDGAADTVTVNGTQGDDVFGAAGDAAGINVFGLQATVNIFAPEVANDRLTLNGLGGDDVINASSLEAGGIQLTMNGGLGEDILIGSAGGDLFNGGDGDDTALMGAGDDVFVWNPGDDNDTLEGQAGVDRLDFNGANVAENIDISANGGRVLFFRNIANVVMDLNDVELIRYQALGGADNVVINDLSGTDLSLAGVHVNLEGAVGSGIGDGAVDTVTVNGAAGNEIITVFSSAGIIGVNGSSAPVAIFNADSGDRLSVNGGVGNDTIDASSLPLGAIALTLDGGNGDDMLFGAAQSSELLLGGAGNDVLNGGVAADAMTGGAGDDTYVVDTGGDVVSENAGEGTDTVLSTTNVALAANVENLVLLGNADLQGFGNGLANAILGNGGNNLIDGGLGGDSMSGGAGNDTYFVDNAGDIVTEGAGQGNDAVFTSINYRLTENVEALVLQGAADLQGFGNAVANSIFGNIGNNLIDGGVGADAMSGGAGNDTYFVDNSADTVIEAADQGSDAVFASINYALTPEVETLVLQGAADLQGFGNGFANTIFGNSGNNLLDGRTGADVMAGGAGNDTYFVDNIADAVIEAIGQGTDAVLASVNFGLSDNVETLVLQGSANLQGFGNSLANTLFGNSGNNLLDGRAGADVMAGGTGNDTYFVDNAGDGIIEAAGQGSDAVFALVDYGLSDNVETLVLQGGGNLSGTGNGLANGIFGNSGGNTLDGGAGADVLTGNAGNDTFVFHAGQANGDTVVDFADNGAAAGDSLQFAGFGTAAQGATFTQIGVTNQWQIHSGLDGHNEIVTFSNGAAIDPGDFLFV